jgi:hypothetical protein
MRSIEEDILVKTQRDKAGAAEAIAALRTQIRDIAVAPGPTKENPAGILSFDKLRLVTDLIRDELTRQGKFFRTADNHGYYFSRAEHQVYDLNHGSFESLLKHLSGLSETEKLYNFACDTLRVEMSQKAERAEVYAIAHFDTRSKRHVVSDGKSGIWWREPGGTWQSGHNGQDGIYFATDPNADGFHPDMTVDRDDLSLDWFWSQFLFKEPYDTETELSRDEICTLLEVWLLQLLFPELRRTRMIPAFLGDQGGGKSTAMRLFGRLIVGPRFEVIGIKKNNDKDWVAAVTNRIFTGFDNADSHVEWLPDELARYATGQNYDMRELFSDNEMLSFQTRANIMLTSRDPYFNRPDVAERLLTFYFARPKDEEYIEELEIFEELVRRRDRIWGELLTKAAGFVDTLDLTKKVRVKFRMADFGSFGLRLLGEERRLEWENVLCKLTKAQSRFATRDDSITAVLRVLLDEYNGVIGPISTGSLYELGKPKADNLKLYWPATAGGFGKMIDGLKTAMSIALDATITVTEKVTANKRYITIQSNDSAAPF